MPYYATLDSHDGGYIQENAHIVRFDSMAEVRDYLLQGYSPQDWNLDTAVVGLGRFGDCWVRSLKAPRVGDRWLAPFGRAHVHVAGPGQHPGGRQYWITPKAKIWVLSYIEETEE